MKLSTQQKNFILDNFFDTHIAGGAYNIAFTLIENGYCVTTGTECIWKGGIGNFIKLEDAPEFVGCVKYNFELEIFLSGAWFKEVKEARLKELEEEKMRIDRKINGIKEL